MTQQNISSDYLAVTVDSRGAQLSSLRHDRAGEMLWKAAPVWPQHAPNLFPIVGQLCGDRLRYGGSIYTMRRHGFAREREFTWLERADASCTLELRDDAQTRALYPFAFSLQIAYTVTGDTLEIRYTLHNPAAQILPASLGAHPAFRWPLAANVQKENHSLEFSALEPYPIRRLSDGLLLEETFPSPVDRRVMPLRDTLFEADAVIFDRLASRSVRYSAPGTPAIVVNWDGFRDLGIWSKPGAEFVCIEPWYGYASPVGFDDSFERKPGIMHVPPDESVVLRLSIAIVDAA